MSVVLEAAMLFEYDEFPWFSCGKVVGDVDGLWEVTIDLYVLGFKMLVFFATGRVLMCDWRD